MKQFFLISLCLIILSTSCKKRKNYTSRIIGHIYNSIDSTPFKNTQFKIYSYSYYPSKTEEAFFATDKNGSFDFSSTMVSGSIVWPSYYTGAAYTGPPKLGIGKRTSTDEKNKIYTYNYDTLYTTPFH